MSTSVTKPPAEDTTSGAAPPTRTVADLSTPTAESLSLLARSALHAKLAGYPGNKPSDPGSKPNESEVSSEVSATTQPPAKRVIISPLRPGATPPSSTLTPKELVSSAAADPTTKPAVNGASAAEASEEKKSSEESSEESSSSESDSSSEGESEEEDKDEKQVVTATARPTDKTEGPVTRRKRGRPPGSAPTTPAGTKAPKLTTRSTGRNLKRLSRPPRRLANESPKRQLGQAATVEVGTPQEKPLKRGRGCRQCPGCMRDDCGKCMYCKDKPKFGGPGVKKQRCALRICSHFVAAAHSRRAKKLRQQPELEPEPATVAEKKSPSASATPKQQPEDTPADGEKGQPGPVVVPSTRGRGTPLLSSTVATPVTTTTTTVPTVTSALRTSTSSPVVTGTPSAKKAAELIADAKMHCIQCSRERKLTLAKSEKFCSQRCLMQWMEDHPEKTLQDAISTTTAASMSTHSLAFMTAELAKKNAARVLKNLAIDMALPGTTLTPSTISPPPVTNPISPPILVPSPKPVTATTIITTRSGGAKQSATNSQPQGKGEAKGGEGGGGGEGDATLRKPSERIAAAAMAGTKRTASVVQPAPVKKPKSEPYWPPMPPIVVTTVPSKSVTFDPSTITIPVSTVQPISAPQLCRTVPPPSISIVPLDQLTALGSALLKQQKSHELKDQPKLPANLPKDIRTWNIAQVVSFFRQTSDCKDYAGIFQEQEVDGTALLLLTHESLVKCLGIKLGRALKIMLHVESLRSRQENQ